MTDDFWADDFHWAALAAGFIAQSQGRLQDSDYVKQLAYELYKEIRECQPNANAT